MVSLISNLNSRYTIIYFIGPKCFVTLLILLSFLRGILLIGSTCVVQIGHSINIISLLVVVAVFLDR